MAHYDCYKCGQSYYDCKCNQPSSVYMNDNRATQDRAACETRGPWVRSSLKAKIKELRDSAKKARGAYTKDFINIPCQYIADTFDAAADVIQERLDQIKE